MPKKLVPNPAYAQARYALGYIWADGKPPPKTFLPEIRTNDRLFMEHGMPEAENIPTHIVVEEN